MARHVTLLVLTAATPALAGPSDYQCVVNQELVPSYVIEGLGPGSGRLERARKPVFVGERFAVDRKTGRVVGSLLDTSGASEIKVLDEGSDANAFKSIAIGNRKIKLLVIRENTSHQEKEFYGVFHPTIIAGLCR